MTDTSLSACAVIKNALHNIVVHQLLFFLLLFIEMVYMRQFILMCFSVSSCVCICI